MYDKVDCHNCEDYEFDDPSLPNNCIHYRYCLAKAHKKEKEEKCLDSIKRMDLNVSYAEHE